MCFCTSLNFSIVAWLGPTANWFYDDVGWCLKRHHSPLTYWMNPNVFKIGLKQALWIVAIIVLLYLAGCEGSCTYVKPIMVYNDLSGGYLGVKRIRGGKSSGNDQFEVIANMEHKKIIYNVKLVGTRLDFFLFDPEVNRYICLRKDKNNSKKKLVARRTLPRNTSLCSFQETASDGSFSNYINQKYNFTMAFNKRGSQITNQTQIEKHKKSSRLLIRNNNNKCEMASEDFCKRNIRNRRHHKKKEISHICTIDRIWHFLCNIPAYAVFKIPVHFVSVFPIICYKTNTNVKLFIFTYLLIVFACVQIISY